jgi:hypothetical protein
MVERVARALFEEEWDDKSSEPWERAEEDERAAWRKSARAAIEAMREPTGVMIAQGSWASDGRNEIGSTGAKNAWRKMIDAALTDM